MTTHRRMLWLTLLMSVSAPTLAQTVSTDRGRVAGVTEGSIEVFRGIPFAAPPTGPNRWRAPQPIAPWTETRKATTFGFSCPQPQYPGGGGPYTPEFTKTPSNSEDCLFLNVWKPKTTAKKLPVFVWIHGGGFGGGAGGVPIYDGAKLASRDMVVVTINYRLGPLGFLAHPALSAEDPDHSSGNYGLLDQVAALDWVERNISNFGGDPANVTIAGQSAGAASVHYLLASPLSRGKFRQAIAESGSGLGLDGMKLADAEANGVAFAAYLGAKTPAEMRALSAEKILDGVFLPFGPPPPAGKPKIRFGPVIDNHMVVTDPGAHPEKSQVTAPLLTGFNTEEAGLPQPTSVSQFEAMVRKRFGAQAERVLGLYAHKTDAEATESSGILARDRYMASLILWTEQRTATAGEPIYRYLFTQHIPVARGPDFGAFHTAEVPYVFGNTDTKLRPYSAIDNKISRQMQNYWLNFARTGNPNGPGLPNWRRAEVGTPTVLKLTAPAEVAPAVSTPERLAVLRDYVAGGGALSLF
ncbi:carboxylesterase/lipase family protein [Sphingomonas faeni]|uniref:carboxylesterase/lipase family protein n=1 Tax=Sphingomonas faeni TaxID=185950 RepID=UPI0024139122|nr:carboxylesterase family protein [Sphingomonas faeni]